MLRTQYYWHGKLARKNKKKKALSIYFLGEDCLKALTSKLEDFIKSEILQPGRSEYPCFG